MTDTPLFTLDSEARWRLAFDRQQWVVQRRVGKPRPARSDSAAGATTGWKAVSFIAGDKRVLHRCIRVAGVVLTAVALTQLDALPNEFRDFLANHRDLSPTVSRRAA